MAQDPVSSVRAALSFEQQALFDALYTQRQKKLGTATVLSLPLLGTFGIEQFYLGNVLNGLLRLIFSFTLIPTISALFDIASGDLKRQVGHANLRLAQLIAQQVSANTPVPAIPEPTVAEKVAAEVALAAAAGSIAMATPVAADETTTTVSITDTTSHWQSGMAEPDITSTTVEVEDTTTSEPEAEGILAFIEDPYAATSDHDTLDVAPAGMTSYVEQIAMSAGNTTHTAVLHTEQVQYQDGKLVAASSHDVLFASEVSPLLPDETPEVTIPTQPTTDWVDISPLTEQSPLDVSVVRAPENDGGDAATDSGPTEPPAYHAPDETNPV